MIYLYQGVKKMTSRINYQIDDVAFKKYLEKEDSIKNDRIRPDDQNFFDALLSEDIMNDPDRIRGIEIIKAL